MALEEFQTLYRQNAPQITKDYFEFLSFPSISAKPENKGDCLKCAAWVERYLKDSGAEVEVLPTTGNPLVLARFGHDPKKPTIMFYGHYDVQPVEPLELWKSPPFQPTLNGNKVYARGAQDDKGQIFTVLSALRAIQKSKGCLPVNVKLCIEGDEEFGSQGLTEILKEQHEQLKADYLAIVDVGWDTADEPSLTMGVRGIVTMTVELTASNTDLHSGLFGGIAYNPNRAMVELLAKLHNEQGKVCVPGFYDQVLTPAAEELKVLNQDLHQEETEKLLAMKIAGGEEEFPPYYWKCLRPTLEINGIGGGYFGAGFKTVIPAKCIAKLSARLVPDQDPMVIAALIEDFLLKNVHPTMQLEFTVHPGIGKAVRTSPNTKVAKCAAQAISEVNKKDCAFILDGATIPVAPDLAVATGADTVLLGYGLPSDQIHAPNEHFSLDRFEKQFLTICRLLELLEK